MKKKLFVILITLSLLISLPIYSQGEERNGSKDIREIYSSFSRSSESELAPETIETTTFKGTINVTTFAGPDSAFEITNSSLYQAQTSFYLEVYTLSSEALVNGLIDASDRGVDVIVLLSHDRVGGYENTYTKESAYRLHQAGIEVLWTSNTYRFTHAKFWIVDSQITYIYSGNWAPSSIPINPAARVNREMGFVFNDADIAEYYEDVFFTDLSIATPYTEEELNEDLQSETTSGTYPNPFDHESFVEYAEVTPIFSPDNSYTLLSNLIQSANTSIDLELQYIKFDCALLDDIIDASLRGVDIRVIIPEPGVANENVTETLITNGISIRFFKGLGHNHNKYVNVDNKIVQVSSINWSNNSITNNREAGAIVNNPNVAEYFTEVFDYDWGNAEIPEGFAQPISIISPKIGEVATGTSYSVVVGFDIYTYTEANLYIDDALITTWTNPTGFVDYDVDSTTYADGMHTVKVVATTDGDDEIDEEQVFNIVNVDEWQLLITEVRYNAQSNPAGEFIEIYNHFDFSVAIGSWILTDGEDSYRIPNDAVISSKKVKIFARDSTTLTEEMEDLGITGFTVDYVYAGSSSNLRLAITGDEVILKDSSDTIMDAVAWGSGSVSGYTSHSGGANKEESLQRIPANANTKNAQNDFVNALPTPGEISLETDDNGDNGYTEDPFEDLSFGSLWMVLLSIGVISILGISRKRRNYT